MNLQTKSVRIATLVSVTFLTVSGCSVVPARHLHSTNTPEKAGVQDSIELARAHRHSDTATCSALPIDCQFERGKPNRFIDGLGNVFGIPEKILLWDRRAENHRISPATEAAARRYLVENRLAHTKVRLNQYAPGGEWRRLQENKNVGAGWRYTIGALSVLGYTVVPGRIFGGDAYNPFTDSIYLYSDIPSVAIHEAAYARDSDNRRFRGAYGTLQLIDGINIWHETIATREALDYIADNGSSRLQAEANRILHPNYGKTVGGSAGNYASLGLPFAIAGAAAGHVTGRLKNHRHQSDSRPSLTQTRHCRQGE